MTANQSFIPRGSMFTRGFGWVILPLLALMAFVAAIPMSWQQQAAFGSLMVVVALVISRTNHGRLGSLILVMLSMCATARYAVWRIDSLHRYFTNPWQAVDGWNAFFMVLLLIAELYTFLILYLGYMQTITPLRRPLMLLPADPNEWPSVDLMVPTYNEPLDVVRYTVLAAKQLDWPADKLNIWLLDDGAREEFRQFAEEAQVGYIARPEHTHAKAGNINYALKRTSGDLVAIFDCDHVPTRSFLQVTTGWFLHDERLAMLQTPHHFYSPDPFERNLDHFRRVPNEGELFYGVVQDTNDFWNATFFCGSCAVLRRTALDEVGGIAHETVTEDAHTSLRMQQRGWNTAYINLAQAGGLATETLGDHVKQRVRWARGMAQILRIDNPLLSRGLNLSQRLCYLNAMLHFMYALPRLVFLSAPILYLAFGKLNIPGYWLTIFAFAVPHLILSMTTNSRVQGMKRHSFWNEIYETVLSPYILLPTLFALVSPKFGKFNVTAKGQNQQENYFDSKLARPFLALLALNVLGLIMAVPRYLYWDRGHTGTIVMNVMWTLFNIVVLGVTLSICWESKQRRKAVRVTFKTPVKIESNGVVTAGVLDNISVGGASAVARGQWNPNDIVRVSFPLEEQDSSFAARVIESAKDRVTFAFEIETMHQQEALTRVLYLKADRWLDWTDGRERDHLFKSLLAVFAASASGFRQSLALLRRKPEGQRGGTPTLAKAAVALLMIAVLFFFLRSAHGATLHHGTRSVEQTSVVRTDLQLSKIGATNGVLLDRTNRNQGMVIALPTDVMVKAGALHLKYTLPPSDYPTSTLEVLLNETILAAVTPGPAELATRHGDITVPVPPELLVRHNQLTMRLGESNGAGCALNDTPTAPIRVDGDSSLSLEEERLVLASDLSLLPEPFIQHSSFAPSNLPIVFARQPSLGAVKAAGVLVSWLGAEASGEQIHYKASLGSLPTGNAVVMLTGEDSIPSLNLPASRKAHIEMIANPLDRFGKLLVLQATTAQELLELAQGLALGQLQLPGNDTELATLTLPSRRSPDDAPRWIHTQRIGLDALNGGGPVHVVDSNPWTTYMRFSPDYSYGPDHDIYMHLEHGNDATELASRSNLLVRLNGAPSDSAAVRPGQGTSRLQEANISLGTLPASVFANTLQVQFYFVPTPAQACSGTHYTGTLASGSYLDIGKPVHLAQLPNLHLFSVAGFPFTRMADLADTVILLSDHASASELGVYFDLLSYFGAQTGYPAIRLQVALPEEAAEFHDKDLLMVGTFGDLAAAPVIAKGLPLQLQNGEWKLSTRARIMDSMSQWINELRGMSSSELSTQEATIPAGVLEQIESPYGSHRSVVLILGQDAAAMDSMAAGLITELPLDSIAGTVSVFANGQFVSHGYSTRSYYLGDASVMAKTKIVLARSPWIFLLALIAIVMLLALWIEACIQYRIHERMMGAEFDLDGKPNAIAP